MPVAEVNEDVLTFLCQKVQETFGGPCEIGPGLPHPSYAFDERRQQYLSSAILGLLNASTLLVPEQIIFGDGTCHAHRIRADGIDVGADGLALDVVTAMGPGGHFLAQRHTRQRMRERWIPELIHPRPSLEDEPVPDIRRRARAELDRILAEHQPRPLNDAAHSELRATENVARQELGA